MATAKKATSATKKATPAKAKAATKASTAKTAASKKEAKAKEVEMETTEAAVAEKPKATKAKAVKKDPNSYTVEDKLKALFTLQLIDSNIDKIRTVRGELPLEVRDLEDDIEGLETRLGKFTKEMNNLVTGITDKKNAIKESQSLIKKYTEQQKNVRNNREFESLTKEIEFQDLEMQLAEKHIKEFEAQTTLKEEVIHEVNGKLEERKKDFDHKNGELAEIVKETEKEEGDLTKKSKKAEGVIEERLITAYKRIRSNARNGLAVVFVDRDACGGCFNRIPPQRKLDIRTRKKIIVCEHCGRILVDEDMNAELA